MLATSGTCLVQLLYIFPQETCYSYYFSVDFPDEKQNQFQNIQSDWEWCAFDSSCQLCIATVWIPVFLPIEIN